MGPKCAYKSEVFTGEKQSLPSTYMIGVTKKLAFNGDTLLVTSDIVKDYRIRANAGVEYKLSNLITLRAGRKLGYDADNFALGLGINYKATALDYFQLDYAFSPVGELGNSHIFSLITKF
jgi:hypothetical protein